MVRAEAARQFGSTASMAVEPLIFELSKPGRRGVRFPEPDVPETPLPEGMTRERLDWPEVSEIDVIRHYTRLSQKNHAIDIGMYPLGSCTMKYNPKVNEVVARLPGFANIHPYQDPGTAVMAGFQVVTIPSDARGNCDLDALRAAVGPDTAGLMITNPNTLGLWDEHIEEIVAAVHEAGGLVYNDGANFNAILGIARPGDIGIDVMHFNLHKTFSTPHGGGGPGSGPVGVRQDLAKFLPGPRVRRVAEDGKERYELFQPEETIGRLHAFHGNFGMFVRAYTYIRMHGAAGPRQVSEDAVLAANYIRASLRDLYDQPFGDRTCMHETVFSATRQKAQGVRALDIAKRILDFGIPPPTVYFPLVVPEALMIEPTETESIESLDHFIGVMRQIAQEAAETPEVVQQAPHTTEYKRLDEVTANRTLNLRWRPEHAAEVKEREREAVAAGG